MNPRSHVALAMLALTMAAAVSATAQAPPKIRLGVHTSLMGAPDVIAIRQGYFKQEGLEVEWRRFALGKDGRDAMIAGAIDINATAPTPFLIGLKNADINSVAQFKGKRIALPKGTITEHVFLTKVAPAHGLKPGDFQVANIPDSKDRIPSLVAKAVDAAALGDPQVAIAEHEGIVRVLEDFCKYDILPFILTATTKIVKEKPDAVVAYLRGWLRAVKLLKEEPEKAAAVYLADQKSMGHDVPLAILDKALRRMKWEPELTPEMDRYLAEQARELVAGGQLRAMPDIAKGLNKEFIRKAMAAR